MNAQKTWATVIGIACLLVGGRALTGPTDGTLVGVTTLLDSGDPAQTIDIVFLGDGFTDREQDAFNARVDQAVAAFLATHPFNALHCAFNIHRVNVASRESGTDSPATCADGTTSTAQARATAMDTTFCAGSVFRCVGSTDSLLVENWATQAPGSDFVVVLVNDSGWGGCRFGTRTFTTLADGYTNIVVHELGHALSNLADEYSSDDPGTTTFPGTTEPGNANLTIATSRGTLKWGDLVLPSTAVPTSTCRAPQSPTRDLVGTFEGGNQQFSCGVFRPQQTCKMRVSSEPFCPVCRRKLVQDVRRSLCRSSGVAFTQLLVRDDSDPWPRGDGEIYFHYQASSGSESLEGRWPGPSGEVDFDDDDERTLDNFFIGELPQPRPGTTGSIGVQVRESDWPDGDDDLSSDASISFSSPMPASFEIDRSHYRLRGTFFPANVKVLLDTIQIKDDMDGVSDGDIYMLYWISNGAQTIAGRWPSGDGDVTIGTGEVKEIARYAGALPTPAAGASLTVRLQLWDEDSWFTGGDDQLGDDTFTYGAPDFGASPIVHVEDRGNYRITLSVVSAP